MGGRPRRCRRPRPRRRRRPHEPTAGRRTRARRSPDPAPGQARVVTTVLRPMTDEELAAWLPRVRTAYADDMVRNGGAAPDAASSKADADMERLFPNEIG